MLSLVLVLLIPRASLADLDFTHAWIKNLPASVPMRAGYMHISNTTEKNYTIVSMSSNAFETVEMHRSLEQDGVTRMEKLPGLFIAAGSSLELKPGGIHLMMLNPLIPIKPGDQVDLWISLDSADIKKVSMTVKK